MRLAFVVVLGLVFAAGLALAGHLIARDTVALPVASLQAGEDLAPTETTRPVTATARTTRRAQGMTTARSATAPSTTRSTATTQTETDDGRGRGRNRGRGGDDSGSGSSRSGSSRSGSSGSGDGSDD
jgi:uncharacterized membrane protein YgcG